MSVSRVLVSDIHTQRENLHSITPPPNAALAVDRRIRESDLRFALSVKASRSPHVGCVRYARTRSPFSLQPQPTACVPCSTHPTDGFKGRLNKRSRRLFHLPCDKKLPEKFLLLIFWPLFSDDRLRFYFAQAV